MVYEPVQMEFGIVPSLIVPFASRVMDVFGVVPVALSVRMNGPIPFGVQLWPTAIPDVQVPSPVEANGARSKPMVPEPPPLPEKTMNPVPGVTLKTRSLITPNSPGAMEPPPANVTLLPIPTPTQPLTPATPVPPTGVHTIVVAVTVTPPPRHCARLSVPTTPAEAEGIENVQAATAKAKTTSLTTFRTLKTSSVLRGCCLLLSKVNGNLRDKVRITGYSCQWPNVGGKWVVVLDVTMKLPCLRKLLVLTLTPLGQRC